MIAQQPNDGILLRMTIPGQPVPKGRPRFTRHGHTYTPKRTVEAERRIGLMAMALTKPSQRSTDDAVALHCEFHVRRKADLDNLIKLVMDGLNGVMFNDDRQVTRLSAIRFDHAEVPRTEIELRRIP